MSVYTNISTDAPVNIYYSYDYYINYQSRYVLKQLNVNQPYKTGRLSATFGLRFIIISYRTHTYEHLEEKICP